MVGMDAFASAFGFDAKSDDVWTTLGKVTAISGTTLSVLLGGSATPTECEAYCLAEVGDIVFVAISKGRARAIAVKGGDAFLPLNGGGSLTGYVSVKHPGIDATMANNGVTANTWPQVIAGTDENVLRTSFFGEAVYPDGSVGAGLWSYNYDTNGNQVATNSLQVCANKDGSRFYRLNDPTAFRDAIGVGAYGAYTGLTAAASLTTTSTKLQLKNFSGYGCEASANGIKVHNAGVYMVWGGIYLSTGFTANDLVHVVLAQGGTAQGEGLGRAPTASPYCTLNASPVILRASAGDVFYLYAYNQTAARGTIADNPRTCLYVKQIG